MNKQESRYEWRGIMSGLGKKRQSNATQLVQVGGHGGEQVENNTMIGC